MANKTELQIKEFEQNYIQYRWLDETRCKLVDRYFIIIIALMVSRFRFEFLENNCFWRLSVYAFAVFVLIFMAKSIISYRRQQRGHGALINAIRNRMFDGEKEILSEFSDYFKYMSGRPVYLTAWIDFAVSILATISPLLFLELILTIKNEMPTTAIIVAISLTISLIILNFVFLIIPCFKYNSRKQIEWKKY